jgi:hypothetical protein
MTRLNGISIAKKNVSSSIAGTSLWINIVLLFASMPTASQSVATSITLWRISSGLSARVVNACLLAIRK